METKTLYAEAGLVEYWILKISEKTLEIHTEPLEEFTEVFESFVPATQPHCRSCRRHLSVDNILLQENQA